MYCIQGRCTVCVYGAQVCRLELQMWICSLGISLYFPPLLPPPDSTPWIYSIVGNPGTPSIKFLYVGCGVTQTGVRRLAVRQARVRIPSRHPYGDPSTERQQGRILSGPHRLRFMLNIVCLNWNINKIKKSDMLPAWYTSQIWDPTETTPAHRLVKQRLYMSTCCPGWRAKKRMNAQLEIWKSRKINLVSKSQIRKFLGSFQNRKFLNFVGVPVHKLQIHKFVWLIRKWKIRKFLQKTALLCLKF